MITKKQLAYKTLFYKVLINVVFLTFFFIWLSIKEPDRPALSKMKESILMNVIWLPISVGVYYLYDYAYFQYVLNGVDSNDIQKID
jgi:hypothetical protein